MKDIKNMNPSNRIAIKQTITNKYFTDNINEDITWKHKSISANMILVKGTYKTKSVTCLFGYNKTNQTWYYKQRVR